MKDRLTVLTTTKHHKVDKGDNIIEEQFTETRRLNLKDFFLKGQLFKHIHNYTCGRDARKTAGFIPSSKGCEIDTDNE